MGFRTLMKFVDKLIGHENFAKMLEDSGQHFFDYIHNRKKGKISETFGIPCQNCCTTSKWQLNTNLPK